MHQQLSYTIKPFLKPFTKRESVMIISLLSLLTTVKSGNLTVFAVRLQMVCNMWSNATGCWGGGLLCDRRSRPQLAENLRRWSRTTAKQDHWQRAGLRHWLGFEPVQARRDLDHSRRQAARSVFLLCCWTCLVPICLHFFFGKGSALHILCLPR